MALFSIQHLTRPSHISTITVGPKQPSMKHCELWERRTCQHQWSVIGCWKRLQNQHGGKKLHTVIWASICSRAQQLDERNCSILLCMTGHSHWSRHNPRLLRSPGFPNRSPPWSWTKFQWAPHNTSETYAPISIAVVLSRPKEIACAGTPIRIAWNVVFIDHVCSSQH